MQALIRPRVPQIVAALLILAALGTAIFLFISYRSNGGGVASPPVEVFIQSPNPGSDLTIGGEPVRVMVYAHGEEAFDSMVLWIDGEAVGQHSLSEGELDNWSSDFFWLPAEAGSYRLLAGVYKETHLLALSSPVPVEIQLDADLESAVGGGHLVLPALGGLPAAPSPTDEEAQPAQPWQGSAGDWLTSLTATEPPAPPALSLDVQGCDIFLSFKDTSDNEEGFLVYRQSNQAPWVQLAKLSSQSEHEWLSYTDEDLSGNVSYYVAAFNSQGISNSNLASAQLSTADCQPPDPSAPSGWYIQLDELVAESQVDLAYCYRSFGENWVRWPQSGFFVTGEEGLQIQGAQERFATLGLQDPEQLAATELFLECWGWLGSQLVRLGSLHASNLLSDAALSQSFTGQGIAATLHAGTDWTNYDQHADWSESTMPLITAEATFEPSVCNNHLGKKAVFSGSYCLNPTPGYNLGPEGVNPQPWIIWTVHDKICKAGIQLQCIPLSSWIDFAAENYFSLRFELWEYSSDDPSTRWFAGSSSEPDQTVFRVLHRDCAGARYFQVVLVIGDNYFVGPWSPVSYKASVPCTKPITGDAIGLDVFFERVDLLGVNDHAGDDTLEVHGSFYATPTSGLNGQERVIGSNNCDNPTGACLQHWSDGNHLLSEVPMCPGPPVCTEDTEPIDASRFVPNNNHIYFPIRDGDGLHISVLLIDDDSPNMNNWLCWGYWDEPPRSLLEWAATGYTSIELVCPPDNEEDFQFMRVWVTYNALP